MNGILKVYLILGAAGAAFLYWFSRSGNAVKIGVAVSQAASDMTAGVVEGAATVVGIPLTNEEKCAKAMSERDSFGVSLYCSAGKFLGYEKDLLFGSAVKQQTTPSNNALSSQTTNNTPIDSSVTVH